MRLSAPSLALAFSAFASVASAQPYSLSIDQLKHVSDTELPPTAGVLTLPQAQPYPATPQAIPTTEPTPTEPSPTVIAVPAALASTPTLISATLVPQLNANACTAALKLVTDVATTAYQDSPNKAYMALVAQAVVIDDVVRAHGLPNLSGFRDSLSNIPWFAPLRTQIFTAASAVITGCQPVGAGVEETPSSPATSRPE